MSEDSKMVWDVVLACLTLLVAGGAFLLSLRQWWKGLDWQRAAKGRELTDDLLKSNDDDEEYYAWDAMKMLDYMGAAIPLRTKLIRFDAPGGAIFNKESISVNRELIENALKSTRENETKQGLLYVRECFDELYFKLGQLQDAIDNDLVELRHVVCPMDYYAGKMVENVELHYKYMQEYGYERGLNFLENFKVWSEGRAKAGLKRIPAQPPEPKGLGRTLRTALNHLPRWIR